MRSPTPEQIAELRRDIDLNVSAWDLPGMRALVLAALDEARARVDRAERLAGCYKRAVKVQARMVKAACAGMDSWRASYVRLLDAAVEARRALRSPSGHSNRIGDASEILGDALAGRDGR
jgi:hypothetical protein